MKKKIKPEIKRAEHSLDAKDYTLGRLATQVAVLLMGKNKANYYPHIDNGDIVNILNPEKIKVTGKKLDDKLYYKHSGYPGGLKATKLKDVLAVDPAKVIRLAVYNMLPKNKLRAEMIKRLKFVKE